MPKAKTNLSALTRSDVQDLLKQIDLTGVEFSAIMGKSKNFVTDMKRFGVALMFMGVGLAAYPTLSMASVVLGGNGNVFALGGIDIRPIVSVMMVFGSVMMLRSALKQHDPASLAPAP